MGEPEDVPRATTLIPWKREEVDVDVDVDVDELVFVSRWGLYFRDTALPCLS